MKALVFHDTGKDSAEPSLAATMARSRGTGPSRPGKAGGRKPRAAQGRITRGALGLAATLLLASCATPVIPLARTPDLARVGDGSHEGSYDAGLVKARVRVDVAAARILEIRILSHDSSPIGKPGEAVAARVVAAQSLEVDVVAGATGSSRTILKAIEAALAAGLR